LDDSPAGGGEGRIQLWGIVSRVGFIVTNLGTSSQAVVRFYNKRGMAEQWIKEDKQARLSCHRFRANEVRLWLSVIAYNLGNLWRRLALPTRVATWSLTSLQQPLVKTRSATRPMQRRSFAMRSNRTVTIFLDWLI
jgi:hypothetical protein